MSLLTQAQKHGNPIIDGRQATLVWHGDKPPLLIGDFNHWGGNNGETAIHAKQDTAGVWLYQIDLPTDAYVEYTFTHQPGDDAARTPDKLNQQKVANGMGYYNHFFYMPDGKPTPFIKRRRNVPHGIVTKHTLSHAYIGGKRDVWLYQPPVDEAVPLVIVYDGKDYLRRAFITHIVDNLIAAKRIRPVALALVENAGRSRFIEYNCGEAILAILDHWVIPLALDKLNLQKPGGYGVLGASMGGLMALYTALRMPDIFGYAVSQSGGFLPFNGHATPLVNVLIDPMDSPPPLKLWLDVGTLEWLYPANQAMYTWLSQRGWDATYLEYNAGHNYTAWRNALTQALPAVFPTESKGL